MGYLIEIDPLRARRVFPQPEETSPFYLRSGVEADSASYQQAEFWVNTPAPEVRMPWIHRAKEHLEEIKTGKCVPPNSPPGALAWISQRLEQMLDAKKQLAASQTEKDRTYFENKCASLDRQIDALVYDLYGLTGEEIKIVEGAAQ